MSTRVPAVVLHRLAQSLLVIWAVVTVVFVVARMTGDPIALLAPEDATLEEIEQLREAEGLDGPLYEQYGRFISDAARLDFGDSLYTRQPATSEISARLGATIQLGAAALAVTVLLGIPLGVLAAIWRGTVLDVVFRMMALVGQAAPSFWIGLLLILIFSVRLEWTPTGGRGGLSHLILPAVTLGSFGVAAVMRITRSSMLEVLDSDFVRTARAKGLSERVIIVRHALRNALLPVVTVLGLQTGNLLSGSVIAETVFAWPGIGRLIVQSINNNDFPLVQACVVFVAVIIIAANAVADVCYVVLDPRLRKG